MSVVVYNFGLCAGFHLGHCSSCIFILSSTSVFIIPILVIGVYFIILSWCTLYIYQSIPRVFHPGHQWLLYIFKSSLDR